jgi:AraC-like DNA-binding protein
MIHVETHFASDLVALGTLRRGTDDPGWTSTCRTDAQEGLGFPRRAFAVTPGVRGATTTVLHAGTVTFTRPSVEYTRVRIDPNGEETDWIWLREDVRRELAPTPSEDDAVRPAWVRPVSPANVLRQRELHASARRAAGPARASRPDQALVEALVLELVRDLGLAPRPRPEATVARRGAPRRIAIQRVVEALAAEPRRRRTTDELADIAGFTPAHFCVAYRAETGRTVSGFLNQLRLCTALDRLRGEASDLSALAHDLGFASHAHFTARFRRQFGCTPSAARTLLAPPPLSAPRAGSRAFARG